VFRPALGPTLHPIQRVPRALSQGQSGRGVKLTTHLHLVLSSKKCMDIYLYSPNTLSLRGAQLKEHRDNFTFTYIIQLYYPPRFLRFGLPGGC